jgi:hypothetical protein
VSATGGCGIIGSCYILWCRWGVERYVDGDVVICRTQMALLDVKQDMLQRKQQQMLLKTRGRRSLCGSSAER